jgi:hypothetical protein
MSIRQPPGYVGKCSSAGRHPGPGPSTFFVPENDPCIDSLLPPPVRHYRSRNRDAGISVRNEVFLTEVGNELTCPGPIIAMCQLMQAGPGHGSEQ